MANVDIYQMTTKDTNHKVAPVTIFDAVVNPLNKKTLDQEFEDMVGAVDENVALDNADETLVTTALRKTNQVLTLAEQTQARTNIGAASATDLTELSTTVSENKTETDGKLTELASKLKSYYYIEPISKIIGGESIEPINGNGWCLYDAGIDSLPTAGSSPFFSYTASSDVEVYIYNALRAGVPTRYRTFAIFDEKGNIFKESSSKGNFRVILPEGYTINVTCSKLYVNVENYIGIKSIFDSSIKSGVVFTDNEELNNAIKELYIEDAGYTEDAVYSFSAFQRNFAGNNATAIEIKRNGERLLIWQSATNYSDVQKHSLKQGNAFFRIIVDWSKIEERIGRTANINHCVFSDLYSPTLYADLKKEEITKETNEKLEETNEKLEKFESDVNVFQDTISETKISSLSGWGSHVNITTNENIDYYGETINATKVEFVSESTNTNMLSLNTGFNVLNAVGKYVTFYILLHSEIEAEIVYTTYPVGKIMELSSGRIKVGWNTITVVVKIDSEYTQDYNLSLIFKQNTEFIGTTIFCKTYYAPGYKKKFITNLNEKFVEKVAGKGLISESLAKTLESLELFNLVNCLTKQKKLVAFGGSGLTHSKEDGIISFEKKQGVGEPSYVFINYLLDSNVVWKKNHDYYVAIDMQIDVDSHASSNGILQGYSVLPKHSASAYVGSGSPYNHIKLGERDICKFKISVDDRADLYTESNLFFFQFGNYKTEDELKGTIYNIFISDLGERETESYISFESVDSVIKQKGLIDYAIINKSFYAERAKIAEKAEIAESVKEIDLWGDSLTAQNYGVYLQEILGRTCHIHGYSGKTSTYIRDEFLKGIDKNRTQIIWVGRNNYHETDVVIDDIRDMVSAFGGQNFIIMPPPNGNYGTFSEDGNGTGEMKGGDGYTNFIKLEERLSEEYPSNFLNIRKAVIQGWRMGNIKLLESFIQPSVGSSVQISVSDATFLTTYNSTDLSRNGEEFMKKIRIGINGKYDVYTIISKDDDTHLTISLDKSNYKSSGDVVSNIVDGGGTSAIKYLRVMQNADYMCWLNDTTLSTYRSDAIHINEKGKKLVSEIIARKIKTMCI